MLRKLSIRKTLGLLALAPLALAVSTAHAQCSNDNLGVWSAQNVGGGGALAVVSPGLGGTNCKLNSTLGASGASRAQVRDDSPSDEPRYRAQFLFDPTNLSGAGGTNQAVIFNANSGTVVGGTPSVVRVQFAGTGAGTKRILIIASCSGGPGGVCTGAANLPNQTGANRIELDLTVGGDGNASLRYWVTDASASSSDASPTGTIALTGGNSAWVGVNQVFLGLSSPSPAYRAVNAGAAAGFDEFDSRRQSFIGS